MRYYIENHTKLYGEPGRTTNTTVAEWKTAVKKSFGLNYYNDMTLEILEQYATFYWVYELQEQYMYGSSRLGSVQRNLPLVQQVLNSDSLIYYSYSNDSIRYMERGQKRYELSNHLGNVLAVVSDRKLVHCSGEVLMWFEAQVVSVSDYYAFGMEIKERSWSVSAYRYGFNGMERDDELKGSGNSYDFGARIYDSRLGRWMSLDPHQRRYSALSAYNFCFNSPLLFNDPDGKDGRVTIQKYEGGGGIITVSTIVYITGENIDATVATRATEVAKDVFKPKTLTLDGQEWTVQFDIKFEAVSEKPELKKGDNLLTSKSPEGNQLGCVESTIDETSHSDFDGEANTQTKTSTIIVKTGNNGHFNSNDFIGKAKAAYHYRVLLHETGHLLGFDDHYAKVMFEGKEYKSGAEAGWSNNDLMVDGMKLSDQHYENYINMFNGLESGDYFYDFYIDVSKLRHSETVETIQYDIYGSNPETVSNETTTLTPTPEKID
jgi:RHS repeat-associated protein